MKNRVQVIWPAADTTDPKTPYVDVHGVLEQSMKLILPKSWLNGEPDALPSSNLLFNGIQGIGKTLLAATLASKVQEKLSKPVPRIVYDCGPGTNDYHLRGSMTPTSDNNMAFSAGPIPGVIHLANEYGCAFLILEELATISERVQKVLNPLTDHRQSIYIPQTGVHYRLNDGCRVIIIATMNPTTYLASNELNPDLRGRFDEFELPLPTDDQEQEILAKVCSFASASVIEKAADFATQTRARDIERPVSTRDLVKLLQNMQKLEGDIALALKYLLTSFGDADRKIMIDRAEAVFDVELV